MGVRRDELVPDVGVAHRPLLQECEGIKPSRVDVTVLECGDGRSVMIVPIMLTVSLPVTQYTVTVLYIMGRVGFRSWSPGFSQLLKILTRITLSYCFCSYINKGAFNYIVLSMDKVKLYL
jgi:hypothetical protein